MAIYSRYPRVLEADGSPLKVRAALGLINAALDEILASGEGDLDAESRFCLAWFEQYGHREGDFGDADVLARARNTSVAGLQRSGVLHQRGGKVRLLKRDELPGDWDPASDDRVPAWECTQQLVRALVGGEGSGEEAAADLARALGPERSEEARALSYRLYGICDRKGWAEEALAYNALVQQWPAVQGLVARGGAQGTLL
jgi:putative DNA methylase